MRETLTGTFMKASDASAAEGMDVDICTPWKLSGLGREVSYQAGWGAGPSVDANNGQGWKLQFSNDPAAGLAPAAGIGARPTDYPASAMIAPSQPNGQASNTILEAKSIGRYSRLYFVAGTGGNGVLPTCDFESDPIS
jgi:hypothetical protein